MRLYHGKNGTFTTHDCQCFTPSFYVAMDVYGRNNSSGNSTVTCVDVPQSVICSCIEQDTEECVGGDYPGDDGHLDTDVMYDDKGNLDGYTTYRFMESIPSSWILGDIPADLWDDIDDADDLQFVDGVAVIPCPYCGSDGCDECQDDDGCCCDNENYEFCKKCY